MRTPLHSSFKAALEVARVTVEEIADALGKSRRAVELYRKGERNVSPDILKKLASFLRQRAQAFEMMANELEQTIQTEEKGEK